jgi:hypothetical protein
VGNVALQKKMARPKFIFILMNAQILNMLMVTPAANHTARARICRVDRY